MTKAYEVTYKDDDLPTHYGFQTTVSLASAEKYYQNVKSTGRDAWLARKPPADRPPAASAVRTAIDSLDKQGRWLDKDLITSKLFVRNATLLCDYLAAAL
jgi:hypothetical protein